MSTRTRKSGCQNHHHKMILYLDSHTQRLKKNADRTTQSNQNKSNQNNILFYVCSHLGDIRPKTTTTTKQHIIIIYTNFPTGL